MEVMVVNTGNATILIKGIHITNNEDLVMGMYGKVKPKALRPNDYINYKIEIFDDIENIAKNEIDLNNHIKIVVWGCNGEKYIQSRGFPVG